MATVIDFTTGQAAPATVGHMVTAARSLRSKRTAKQHPDARLLELGGRLLALMRDWETFDDRGMTDKQMDRVGDVYEELVAQLRRKFDAIAPRTVAGVRMKLRCLLLFSSGWPGTATALADDRMSKEQVERLEPAEQDVWRLIQAIQRADGRQRQGEGA